jgi:succinoglycan biosynthesis protein ExoM
MITQPISRVAIAIITYKRPLGLAKLLRSIEAANSSISFRTIVVDNDASGSARAVALSSPLDVTYLIEPQPGIAAARNRCLDSLHAEDDAIVFVDDDEIVTEGWLDELVAAAELYEVDVACGAVVSVFPPNTPVWLIRGGFMQRPIQPTGSSGGLPATNNVLIRTASLLSAGNPKFDESFSMTGGSDSDFFWRLLRTGSARMIWTSKSVVSEEVDASRMSRTWVWNRSVRLGNVLGRLQMREQSRTRVLAFGVVRITYALGLALYSILQLRDPAKHVLVGVGKGVGVIRATRNKLVQEYARDK